MQTVYGIEAKSLIEEVTAFKQIFETENPYSYKHGSIYIYADFEKAQQAQDFLQEVGFFEEQHDLLLCSGGKPGDNFSDYGLAINGLFLLFKVMIVAFELTGNDRQALKMAQFQLEEHLVFTLLQAGSLIYFAGRYDDELISRINAAYNVKCKFLDLDKCEKNL